MISTILIVIAGLIGLFGCVAHVIARTVDHEELDVRGFGTCFAVFMFSVWMLFF